MTQEVERAQMRNTETGKAADLVNEANAYQYSDNYSILASGTDACVGCEHNLEHADAIARYLTNYHGRRYTVRKNRIDLVKEAKRYRSEPMRVSHRDFILRELGF